MEIRRPRDEQELAAALALREEVFCGEQGVRLDGDRDGRDAEALQLVAVDGEVLGTCRLLVEPGGTAKFARLCVRRERARPRARAPRCWPRPRRRRARPAPSASACTRRPARSSLYERAGYTPYGERFDEEGIEHLGMEKHLT